MQRPSPLGWSARQRGAQGASGLSGISSSIAVSTITPQRCSRSSPALGLSGSTPPAELSPPSSPLASLEGHASSTWRSVPASKRESGLPLPPPLLLLLLLFLLLPLASPPKHQNRRVPSLLQVTMLPRGIEAVAETERPALFLISSTSGPEAIATQFELACAAVALSSTVSGMKARSQIAP
eukprot:scaffold817_cov246-Pinguiococcus_pyrenoidosus.AAC.8